MEGTATPDTWCPQCLGCSSPRAQWDLRGLGWPGPPTAWSWKKILILQVGELGPQAGGWGASDQGLGGSPGYAGSPQWNRNCSWCPSLGGSPDPLGLGAPPEPLIAQKLVPVSCPPTALSLPSTPSCSHLPPKSSPSQFAQCPIPVSPSWGDTGWTHGSCWSLSSAAGQSSEN